MRFFLLLCIMFAIVSCKSELEMIETKDEDGYTIKYTRKKQDFAKQGKLTKFYPDGKLYEEANYENDTLHGERRMYYENGTLEILETYDHGTFTSPYVKYYENGQPKLEGFYDNNIATGLWKRYYENGQLMEEVTLADNEENGPFREYYENGNIKAEGTYNGMDEDTGYPREHGELKMYDETGELIKRMQCDMGRCNTVWTKEGGDQ